VIPALPGGTCQRCDTTGPLHSCIAKAVLTDTINQPIPKRSLNMSATENDKADSVVPEVNASNGKTVVMGSMNTPNTGLAIFLALIFGPLGLFYSSIIGGIVMLIISIPVVLVSLGLGLVITLPICAIWAGMAASIKNKKARENLAVAMS